MSDDKKIPDYGQRIDSNGLVMKERVNSVLVNQLTNPKTVIHGIVEIDESGFSLHGEKVEDAGEAHRAFLSAIYGIRQDVLELRDRLQEIADHVGEWDDQEVRDEIERIVGEMEE